MTKQEAIDELHKHYIPEYVNYIVTALTDGATPSDAPTINAIPIPENATNGEVIKMMFPNTTIFVDETHNVVWFELYHDKYDDDFDIDITFTLDWWNTPYKTESEDK